MTDRLSNEERGTLIAGHAPAARTPDESADISLLADLLAEPAIWAEPSVDLEDTVVLGVADAEPIASVTTLRTATQGRRRASRWTVGAAAAVVAIIALGAGINLARNESGPDFEGDLAATALVRHARASVEMYDSAAGFRVTLDAHGLAPLPAGEYYEAWVHNAAGTAVPIGTFSSSDGRVALWSGVSPKSFPNVTVTIEATDNQQAPSGRRVLTGVVHPA
jgi:hypothetical protein